MHSRRARIQDTDGKADDLSLIYLMRNDWSRKFLAAYHEIIPKSEPVEDWEARIELYALYVVFLRTEWK